MIRLAAIVLFGFLTAACKQPVPRPSITQFKATPSVLPVGIAGKLCYGVENAAKLELTPAVEQLLPASERCIDIAPKQTTTYTLTAWGKDGNEEKKSLEVKVGPPAPRLSNLAASSTRIKRGAPVKICFKVENANSVTGKPGKLDRRTNCLTDRPRNTTTYKITALGPNHQEDSGTVTVNVER
jgi:hypothetical protein